MGRSDFPDGGVRRSFDEENLLAAYMGSRLRLTDERHLRQLFECMKQMCTCNTNPRSDSKYWKIVNLLRTCANNLSQLRNSKMQHFIYASILLRCHIYSCKPELHIIDPFLFISKGAVFKARSTREITWRT